MTLANALEFTILAAEVGDERWPKLAARWHCRFVSETPGIGAGESAFVLAAAGALGGPLCDWPPGPCDSSYTGARKRRRQPRLNRRAQRCDALVDERREMVAIALLNIRQLPIVPGNDTAA